MSRPAWEVERDRLLREAGFEDIESTSRSSNGLIKGAINPASNRVATRQEEAAYYDRAGAFLHRHQFANDTERNIWRMHADGAPYDEIKAALHVGKTRVKNTIHRLRAAMLTRRRGRPEGPMGNDAYQINPVRLRDDEAEALEFLVRHLGTTENETVRLCIKAQAILVARRISGTEK